MRPIIEDDMSPIVRPTAGALMCEVGLNSIGEAKKLQSLIDQMRSQVEPDAAAGSSVLTPAVMYLRSESVDAGLEMNDRTNHSLLDSLTDSEKIAVPAAIVKHRQD